MPRIGSDLRHRRPALMCAAALALAASSLATPARAASPASVEVAVRLASFNYGHSDPSTLYGIELRRQLGPVRRLGRVNLRWKPTLALFVTSEDARFASVGMRLDLELDGPWRLTPGFDIGSYSRGDDIDLGYSLEFRSSLELSRAFGRRQRLGVQLDHISNASLSDVNPGSNTFGVVYALRFGG